MDPVKPAGESPVDLELGAGSEANELASDDPSLPFDVLLERERISVVWNGDYWTAEIGADAFNEWRAGDDPPFGTGATPREAALACLRAATPPKNVGRA